MDRSLSAVMQKALSQTQHAGSILVIDIDDPQYKGDGALIGSMNYETFLSKGAEVRLSSLSSSSQTSSMMTLVCCDVPDPMLHPCSLGAIHSAS